MEAKTNPTHPVNAPIPGAGGQVVTERHGQLIHHQSEENGDVEARDATESWMVQVERKAPAGVAQARSLERDLEYTSHQQSHRQAGHTPLFAQQQCADDDGRIEGGGGKGREGKTLERVERRRDDAGQVEEQHRRHAQAQ